MIGRSNDVTRILSLIEAGEAEATEQLLPLVYDELTETRYGPADARKARPDAAMSLAAISAKRKRGNERDN